MKQSIILLALILVAANPVSGQGSAPLQQFTFAEPDSADRAFFAYEAGTLERLVPRFAEKSPWERTFSFFEAMTWKASEASPGGDAPQTYSGHTWQEWALVALIAGFAEDSTAVVPEEFEFIVNETRRNPPPVFREIAQVLHPLVSKPSRAVMVDD